MEIDWMDKLSNWSVCVQWNRQLCFYFIPIFLLHAFLIRHDINSYQVGYRSTTLSSSSSSSSSTFEFCWAEPPQFQSKISLSYRFSVCRWACLYDHLSEFMMLLPYEYMHAAYHHFGSTSYTSVGFRLAQPFRPDSVYDGSWCKETSAPSFRLSSGKLLDFL